MTELIVALSSIECVENNYFKSLFPSFPPPPDHLARAVTSRMGTVPNWRSVVSKGEGCGDGDDRITCVAFLLSVQGRLYRVGIYGGCIASWALDTVLGCWKSHSKKEL